MFVYIALSMVIIAIITIKNKRKLSIYSLLLAPLTLPFVIAQTINPSFTPLANSPCSDVLACVPKTELSSSTNIFKESILSV